MSVDHCFSIKGQGTVMTGTILSGTISLGDNVEIPALKVSPALTFLSLNPTLITVGERPGPCSSGQQSLLDLSQVFSSTKGVK